MNDGRSRFLNVRVVVLIVILVSVTYYGYTKKFKGYFYSLKCEKFNSCLHIHDEAGVIPAADRPKFDQYLDWIFKESDIDLHLAFVKGTGSKTIEELALEKVQKLNIGGKSKEERGVLMLYDTQTRRFRIEVGYGLEEYFPDAFVSYLIHFHTRHYFGTNDLSLGFRLLLRIMQHRIRQAILGDAFDPRVVEFINKDRYLSGGAGVSAVMDNEDRLQRNEKLTAEERRYFKHQGSPEEAYLRYLEWLQLGKFDTHIELFTNNTQGYMSNLQMSKAYFEYILLQEYGREFKIDVRDELALLYFTNDPLVTPHFLVKGKNGWQMDIMAEIGKSINRVGGVFTWDYRGTNDKYTKRFADKFVNIRNYIRIKYGDNRMLPIRG
ncbi:MAG: TPM domain-containing protein [Nitrospirae bacterium]|nr:MAG: TPM domain-containing protein [Nitrospirota bacterium]